MTRKKVWRYYCDHCKKSGCSGGHMKAHERGCTMNPQRHCGMCDHGGLEQQSTANLIAVLEGATKADAKERIDRLRDATGGCPACMLAAIRQAGVMVDIPLDGGGSIQLPLFDFTFKHEKDAFWAVVNDEAAKNSDGHY